MVSLATKHDPRVIAEDAREKAEIDRIKKEKFEKKEKERQAKETIEREVREKKEAIEKAKIEDQERRTSERKAENLAKKTAIEELESLADEILKPVNEAYDRYFIEEFVKPMSSVEMQSFINDIKSQSPETSVKYILEQVKSRVEEVERTKLEAKMLQKKNSAKSKEKQWSEDDLHLLTQGMNKFPAGLKNRWKYITDYFEGRFEFKEVIQKGQKVMNQKSLVQAGRDVYKEQKEEPKKPEPTQYDWSEEQQKALEGGLKKFRKSLPPKERWTSIAGVVEGKTAKECLARYKHVVAMLKNKK